MNYTMPGIDGETRTAGIPTLIQKVIFNYSLFYDFFHEACVQTDKQLFSCVTDEEWKLLIEIESIVEPLARFA